MAIAVASLGTGSYQGTGTTLNWTTGSYSPSANCPLILLVSYNTAGTMGTAGLSTCTGFGLTWTRQGTVDTTSGATAMDMWTANTGASAPSPGGITLTATSTEGDIQASGWDLLQATGCGSPWFAAGSFVSVAAQGSAAASTLACAAPSGNGDVAVAATMLGAGYSVTSGWTSKTGFTTLDNPFNTANTTNGLGNAYSFMSQYSAAETVGTTPTSGFTWTTSERWAAMAIELIAATSALPAASLITTQAVKRAACY